MSWSKVAASLRQKKVPSSTSNVLSVRYNIEIKEESDNDPQDRIPRHRELTPDPADDFMMTKNNEYDPDIIHHSKHITGSDWIDYRTDTELSTWKSSLPYSIQQIIDLQLHLFKYHKVITLDFLGIEKDLKIQRKKYRKHKTKLWKLYQWGYDARRF